MRVSTSTNLHYAYYGFQGKPYAIEDSIQKLVMAGYKVLDFNFDAYCVNRQWMNDADWMDHVLRTKEFADSLGADPALDYRRRDDGMQDCDDASFPDRG